MAGFCLFVVAYEEPVLGKQFADEYQRYRANVRRWLPRIAPSRGQVLRRPLTTDC